MNNKVKYSINTKLIDDFKIGEIDERHEEGLIYYLDHKVEGVSWVSEEVITSLLAKPLPRLPLEVCVWLETAKDCGKTLAEAIGCAPPNGVYNWIWELDTNHMELFTRAWREGYTEDVKCYLVTDGGICYLSEWTELDDDMVIITSNTKDFDRRVKKYYKKEAAQEVAEKLGWQVQEEQAER